MIQIHVVHSAVVPSVAQAGVRGSYAAEALRFDFTPEWNGLTKKLIFFPQRGAPVFCVYEDGDEVVIPYRVMKCAGNNTFILSGYSLTENNQIAEKVITAEGILYVSPAPSDTLLEPDIPEATVFEEIVAKLGAPYIGENGDWYEWDPDTRDFVDTGTPARGPQGETGRGLVILGKYASVEALEEAVTDPEVGDAYDVGTDTLYTYIWDGAEWVSHGDIRGIGVESVEQISVSTESGGVNVIRVTLTDGTYTDFEVRNGAKGAKGDPGNVYYGTGTPPDDAAIWINPSGEPNVVDQILQAAESANASADSAYASAGSASTYASAAQTAKNDAISAKNAAVAAKSIAEAAQGGAEDALAAATSAKTDAETAQYLAVVAKNSAQSSATDASLAQSAAIGAKNSAIDANTAAQAANLAAQTAKTDAIAAKNDAVSASMTAQAAKDDAVSAKTDAVAANTSAQTASTAAQAANTAAQSAKTDAVAASTAAQAAKTDAEAASTAAQAAQTAAEAAADAAQDTVYLTDEDDGDARYTMAWSVRGGYPVLTLTPIEEA